MAPASIKVSLPPELDVLRDYNYASDEDLWTEYEPGEFVATSIADAIAFAVCNDFGPWRAYEDIRNGSPLRAEDTETTIRMAPQLSDENAVDASGLELMAAGLELGHIPTSAADLASIGLAGHESPEAAWTLAYERLGSAVGATMWFWLCCSLGILPYAPQECAWCDAPWPISGAMASVASRITGQSVTGRILSRLFKERGASTFGLQLVAYRYCISGTSDCSCQGQRCPLRFTCTAHG